MDILPKKINRFYSSRWLPFIIICFGIVLRLHRYLYPRSLWLDEACLALNIVNRSYLQLLQQLDYNQFSPFGFLMIEKLMVQIFGNTEYVLKAFPCLAGIVSLFVFYKVAKWFIKPMAIPIALGLFAISNFLNFYSSTVKQYSSDVAIALLLFVVTIYIQSKQLTALRIVLFGVIGAIAVWFAATVTFVLIGLATGLTILYLKKKDWTTTSRLAVVYLIWALGIIAYGYVYVTNYPAASHIETMRNFFSSSIIIFPPRGLKDIKDYIEIFFAFFRQPAGFPLSGIAAFAFLVGWISMFREKKEKFLVLASPLVITPLVSAFIKYPLEARMILFLLPFSYLFIAEGVMCIIDKTRVTLPVIGIIIFGLLFYHPLLSVYSNLKQPCTYEEIKSVINYVREHKRKGDVLYLYYCSQPAFKYYSENYGFDDNDYIVGVSSRDNWENYIKDLDKLRGIKRVWILFSHVCTWEGVDEEKFFLFYLDRIGTRLDSFKSIGAVVYLYDLSEKILDKDKDADQ